VPAMMFDQLVERFRLEQMPGSTRFTVQLHPEHLGRVEIETRQEGEILTAVIRAEDPQTRQSLEAGLDVLLERLEEAGIEVHRAEITNFQSGNNPDHENRRAGAGSRNRRTSTNRGPVMKETATETVEEAPERVGGVSYFA
jgi:flagellar hook-length control protein FliK